MPCRLMLRVLISAVLIGLPTVASAEIAFTRIADTNTLIPGTTSTFAGFGTPSLSGGEMAFTGGGGPISEGIYSTKGGLHTVVDTLGNFPGTPNQFRNFQGPSFDGSTVALTGSTLAGDQGLLAGNGSLQVIADKTTPIPGGTGNFLGIGSGLVSNGEFAFIGVGDSNQRGVYRTMPGGLARVADQTTSIPDRTGEFLDFKFLSFDGSASRLRRVGSSNLSVSSPFPAILGVYSNLGGTLPSVADIATRRCPVVRVRCAPWHSRSPATKAIVAFIHGSTESRGFQSPPGLTVLCNRWSMTKPPFPTVAGSPLLRLRGGGPVRSATSSWGRPISAGIVARIYALFDDALFLRIIEVGDERWMDESSPRGLISPEDAFGGNQVAFRTEFTDGTSGIYLATIPEPATLTLLAVLGGVMQRRGAVIALP
jgi:hypothetical protein